MKRILRITWSIPQLVTRIHNKSRKPKKFLFLNGKQDYCSDPRELKLLEGAWVTGETFPRTYGYIMELCMSRGFYSNIMNCFNKTVFMTCFLKYESYYLGGQLMGGLLDFFLIQLIAFCTLLSPVKYLMILFFPGKFNNRSATKIVMSPCPGRNNIAIPEKSKRSPKILRKRIITTDFMLYPLNLGCSSDNVRK